jgi:hypothetical protein
MGYIAFALIIGLLPASIAKNKGKDFVIWWIYGAALFIVALPHALMMDADADALEFNAIAKGGKKCPDCGEVVKAEAKICRFCQRPIVEGVAKSEALKNNKYKRQPVSRLQFIGMGIIFVSVLGLIAFVGSFLIH